MATDLIICVKQGEDILRNVKLKAGGSPLDLSTYSNITVQVKKAPLIKAQPLFEKVITDTSDDNTNGRIISPSNGEFVIRFTKEDTSYSAGDYFLVIILNGNGMSDIVSSNCCNQAIYRICTQ
jgi:hypothetical protein